MRIYATTDAVERWMGEAPPENAEALLRRASTMVAHATRAAVYDTTPAGMPSDPDVAEAMEEAVCAQVAMWATAGVDPASATVSAQVSRSSIDGASVDYDTAMATAEQNKMRTELCPEAVEILTIAGLIGGRPWVR